MGIQWAADMQPFLSAAAEIMQGHLYWCRERDVCSLMLATGRGGAIGRDGCDPGFSIEDIHATSAGKSFDYRVRSIES